MWVFVCISDFVNSGACDVLGVVESDSLCLCFSGV